MHDCNENSIKRLNRKSATTDYVKWLMQCRTRDENFVSAMCIRAQHGHMGTKKFDLRATMSNG